MRRRPNTAEIRGRCSMESHIRKNVLSVIACVVQRLG
jgi:hypothetical protein